MRLVLATHLFAFFSTAVMIASTTTTTVAQISVELLTESHQISWYVVSVTFEKLLRWIKVLFCVQQGACYVMKETHIMH